MHVYRKMALRKALAEVGVKENPPGSNRGARVDEYQRADLLTAPDVGYSWCASFVNWCYQEVGRPLVELDRSASVGHLLAKARERGWAHTKTPKPGDLVCYDWNTLTGPGKGDWPDHIGIVAKVFSDGSFDAVEGNTAVGNDSNGGQVMVRGRNRSMVESFIRVPGGFKYVRRYRVYVNGHLIGTWRLTRVVRKAVSLIKRRANGESVKFKRVRVRKEVKSA